MITLPLNEMSVEEKLEVMELLWDDLSRNGADIPSPDWHGSVLRAREEALATGEEDMEDWEAAKERLRGELF